MKPNLRFKGFDQDWENKRLSQILSIGNGCDYKHLEPGNIPVFGTGGLMTHVNSFLYDGESVFIGRKGTIDKPFYFNGKFWTVDTLFYTHSFLNSIPKYIYPLFLNIKWQLYNAATGVPSLSKDTILGIETAHTTDIKEQQKLADYFSNLDAQICSSVEKTELLRKLKAASLQSMFPQQGEQVPRLRFKGFSGNWNLIKFNNLFEQLKNNSLSRDQLSNVGDVKNVHYGDVLIKYGEILKSSSIGTFVKDLSDTDKLNEREILKTGDIIFADAAEDSTVGKCCEIEIKMDDVVVSGLHTIAMRPKQKFATNFLGYYLNSSTFHNQLLPLIQGSKISSISKKSLNETNVLYPDSLKEQHKIGEYFCNLDKQIQLEEMKLEKLRQVKTACLKEMFV